MHAYWSRDDTRDWIVQLENRISDVNYYLQQTVNWCQTNDVVSDRAVFVASFMTVLWVSSMRNESISYNEALELLGLKHLEQAIDRVYELGAIYNGIDHEDLLKSVTSDIL